MPFTMYDSMFQLLNLTPLTFSLASAKRNYKSILSAVHPDKCNSVHAVRVSSFVTHAYVTLTDPVKRLYYMRHGAPSPLESYNNVEASEVVGHMNRLVSAKERERDERRQQIIREASRAKREEEDIAPFNAIGNLNARISNHNSPVNESRFEDFLNQCRKSAAASFDPDTKEVSTDRSSVPEDSSDHDIVDQSQCAPSREDSVNKTSLSPRPDEDMPTVFSIARNARHGASSPHVSPEVISIDSGDESEETVDYTRWFGFDSPVARSHEYSPSRGSPDRTCSEEDGDEYRDVNSRGRQRNLSHLKDAATSPLRSKSKTTFKDAGTSPFKPGDKVTFYTLPDLASPRVRRNLSFDDSSPPSSHRGRSSPSPSVSGGSNWGNNRSFNDFTSDYSNTTRATNNPDYNSIHKEYIAAILGLRTRQDGVRFKVKWGPGGYETTERAEVVLRERRGLRIWLDLLHVREPRRYNAIMRFHPEFQAVFKP